MVWPRKLSFLPVLAYQLVEKPVVARLETNAFQHGLVGMASYRHAESKLARGRIRCRALSYGGMLRLCGEILRITFASALRASFHQVAKILRQRFPIRISSASESDYGCGGLRVDQGAQRVC
jgi:hypothetical protein